MKAMILAAGLGTRLRPLTHKRPKALMPVVNQPIIQRTIDYLNLHGITEIVINAHHHSWQLLDYFDENKSSGPEIHVRVEAEILGTGGGIKNTEDFWDDEPFIVINSDILTDIDLSSAYKHHKDTGSLVTLVLHDYDPFNQIQIDINHRLTDVSQSNVKGRLAFTGIHIINPALLSYISDPGYSDIIDCYRSLIVSRKSIYGYISEGHYWRDIGSLENYKKSNRDMMGTETLVTGPGTRIDYSVRLKDWVVMGKNCIVEENAKLERSILWDNVKVKKGTKIFDSIITSFREVEHDLINKIF